MRRSFFVLVAVALLMLGQTAPTQAGPNFHCNQVHMHPNSLPAGQVGFGYSALLWLTPANPSLQVTVTNVLGTLPPGLVFTPGPNLNQVTLSGTPTAAGTYTFSVEIGGTYVLGTICKVVHTYTVTILP